MNKIEQVYASKNINLRKPFPSDHEYLGKAKPRKLDYAVKIKIPERTIQPWRILYKPFGNLYMPLRKIIFVEENQIVIQKRRWYKPDFIICMEEDSFEIPFDVPYRIMNSQDKPSILSVESSHDFRHRTDIIDFSYNLEPEFRNPKDCLHDLYEHNIEYMSKL